jgi:hypothetical protein
MILTCRVIFGVPFRFELEAKWGPRVELEAIEFLNGAPIDWRIGNDPVRPGLHTGREFPASMTSNVLSGPEAPVAYQPQAWTWRREASVMQHFSSGSAQRRTPKQGTAELDPQHNH